MREGKETDFSICSYLKISAVKKDQSTEFDGMVARRNGAMRMMEFELFSARKQIATLYAQGVYVGKNKTGKFVKLLFQLDSFYVEIVYVTYRSAIYKIRFTDSTTILDEY